MRRLANLSTIPTHATPTLHSKSKPLRPMSRRDRS